jgi:hypothetical protein
LILILQGKIELLTCLPGGAAFPKSKDANAGANNTPFLFQQWFFFVGALFYVFRKFLILPVSNLFN